MHILVVDPNAGFAALLASELERLGHEVVPAVRAMKSIRP